MKITLIITGLGMGGAERQVCDLADQFAENNHQVLVISMTGENINLPQSTLVEVVSLNMSKTPLGFISAYRQTRKLIKAFKPNVVHSHMVHANLFARLLRLSTQIEKLVCTAHSSNEGGLGRMLAYRFTDSLCDLNTNVSQEAVDISVKRRSAPARRIIAMHNGIDTERFTFNHESRATLRATLKLLDQTPLILAVGRLTEAKDYPNLLTAFAQLPYTLDNSQLVIIGTGEEQAPISALAAQLGLTSRVHFLGLQRNVHEWMSAADVFVLSSAWEGFGLVVAEAMACERVVVATDCGGVREVVGDAGFLVEIKNSQQLAAVIEEAINLPVGRKKQLGTDARQRVIDRYSLSVIADKWLEIYSN
ncbi:glycosyltransferase [Shewanella sp. SM32]|uniref:glycosyltransferase n=1 Tax=Shewanella sp. SM32 TaxID=2912796 RepID=UPI0021D90F23|nr:glycosyltransferase [Shewanella sp. SM32]MCU8069542.1 glycosyltransferase [Shewanella sp. SM32]